MSLDRTLILTGLEQVMSAVAVIRANWEVMAKDGHPLAVRLYEHKDNRTLEQNALMWVWLGELAAQAWVDGRQYSDEVWHEHLKREYLPDEIGPTKRCRKGYVKWSLLPNGTRVLIGSTTQLTTAGFSEHMEQLTAFGAGLGVRFSAMPGER